MTAKKNKHLAVLGISPSFEQQYHRLIEQSAEGIFILSPEGDFLLANSAVCALLGYTPAGILKANILDTYPPEMREAGKQRLGDLRRGASLRFVRPMLRQDGSTFLVEANTLMLPDGNLQAVVNDITARDQAEQALRRSEENLHALLDAILESVLLIESDGTVIATNQTTAGRLRTTVEELIGRNVFEVLPPDVADSRRKFSDQVIASGRPVWFEDSRLGRFIINSIAPIFDSKEQVSRLAIFGFDITERRQAEDSLRQSELRYRQLIEQASDGIFITSPDLHVIEVNTRGCDLLGYSPEELLQKNVTEIIAPGELPSALPEFEELCQGKVVTVEQHLIRQDGSCVPVEISARLLPDAGFMGLVRDITERKQAEQELRFRKREFQTLVENSPDAITRFDLQGRYVYVNPARARYFGLTPQEIIGKTWWDLLGPQEQEEGRIADQQFQKMLCDPQEYTVEYQSLTPQGLRWVQSREVPEFAPDGSLESVIVVSRDITEIKQAEERIRNLNAELAERVDARTRELHLAQEKLLRQEKLAVLGQLAGGVGHELRNPLTVINNAVYFLRLIQPQAEPKVQEYLQMIEEETRMAGKIVNDLLDFTRSRPLERDWISAGTLLQNVLRHAIIPAQVKVSRRIAAGLPNLYIDAQQISQVLGNLVLNACQAMPQGGKLTLSASQKGAEIAILVRDTGEGISPENMSRLFEPLFTTKMKGIGLGLAVSRKLVEGNGGRIEVSSEPGKGAAFTIFLPLVKKAENTSTGKNITEE